MVFNRQTKEKNSAAQQGLAERWGKLDAEGKKENCD